MLSVQNLTYEVIIPKGHIYIYRCAIIIFDFLPLKKKSKGCHRSLKKKGSDTLRGRYITLKSGFGDFIYLKHGYKVIMLDTNFQILKVRVRVSASV